MAGNKTLALLSPDKEFVCPSGRRPIKVRHKEESMSAPRSLFDRPSSALARMRRDMKLQKCRGIVRPPLPIPGLKPPTLLKPAPEPENVPEWAVYEDWAILQSLESSKLTNLYGVWTRIKIWIRTLLAEQSDTVASISYGPWTLDQVLMGTDSVDEALAVQSFQELPLNLMILSPGHTPNWDMVSDMVNTVSRAYRSPKQCRNRYESVIVPREEGKLLFDPSPKKQKKTKSGMYKFPSQTKTNRPMRTSQLYMQDNNLTSTQIFVQRFDAIKGVSNKRTPTVKPLLANPSVKNPKHAAVLAENNINIDCPLTPVEIAARRAERILKEKQKSAQASAAAQTVVVSTLMQTSTVATLSPALRPQRPVATLTVQEMVSPRTVAGSPTVVSVASLVPAVQMQAAAQRLATASLVSQASAPGIAVSQSKDSLWVAGSECATQLQYYRQQALIRHQQQQRMREQHLKAMQAQGQKLSVAVTTSAALQQQQQQQQQRAQLIKQAAAGGIARTVTESEMAALIKRQQQQQQHKAAASGQVSQVQVPVQAGLTPAQILAQAGLQVQQASQAQVATLVKAVSSPGMTLPQVRATLSPAGVKTAGNPSQTHQIRQLALHQHIMQRKLPPQLSQVHSPSCYTSFYRLSQEAGMVITLERVRTNKPIKLDGVELEKVTGKGGLPTQLIVQSPKTLPTTVTMQQIQHVIKSVQQQQQQQQQSHITHVSGAQAMVSQTPAGQVISHAVLTKSSQAPAGSRVIPVSTSHQQLKQTIQVVTAAPGVRTSVPSVTLDSSGRSQVTTASTLASALAGIKVAPSVSTAQHQAIISQVNAALQAQQQQALRQANQRLQAPLMAVTVQSQQQAPGPPANPSDQLISSPPEKFGTGEPIKSQNQPSQNNEHALKI
uniref:Uncharacterized protein n=1 Tax=Timema bartmani TaxID=61472 RepID=A0A7R9ES40_9NEOP|nr:unnamed protein product [Timema bartmani]